MKTVRKILPLLSLLLMSSISINNNLKQVNAASLPNSIILNDNTEEEIRNYYSSFLNLEENELRGENLLKNLKPILSQNNVFYSYDTVSDIYKITDRNWESSPASELDSTYGNYDVNNNKIINYSYKDNPYIFHYYVDRDYQKDNPIKYKEEGASSVSFDKEHIWAKSHGFGLEGNAVVRGAGTDLHNLVAANPSVNSSAHNNYSYGYVKDNAYNAKEEYLQNNKRGTPLRPHNEDETNVVFEPQDSDKGDIARALCYMVARYNYIGQINYSPSKEEPNLTLVDYIIKDGFDCSTSLDAAPYGILSDILSWNKLDKVDQYEIHRNNLIYNNYQYNRNPFIDFPTWIDLIWNEDGTFYNGNNFANPSADELNVGNEYIPPVNDDTFDLNQFIQDNKILIAIIALVIVVIIIIIIIILIKNGDAKIKITKSGKAKLIIKKTPSSKSKTNKNSRSKTSSKTKNKTTKTKTKPIK